MSVSVTKHPGRRLRREIVVTAALEHIDRAGLQSLSMRRLGDRLGVEAMSLYRHISGREDLLEAVVERLLTDLEESLDAELGSTWQGYLQGLAHAVRAVGLEHPRAFPLIATRHPAAPWLRPPLRSLSLVEGLLSTLLRHGFDEEQAAAAYRAFSSFLLGHLLLECAVRGAGTVGEDCVEPPDAGAAELDLSELPTVRSMRDLLSEDHSQEEFETALETLLDRLELSLSE